MELQERRFHGAGSDYRKISGQSYIAYVKEVDAGLPTDAALVAKTITFVVESTKQKEGTMTGVLKIYGNHVSGNCWKVKWTADALGLSNEWIEVDIFAGQSRAPNFLAKNPWGQVPTVVFPDGRVLTQSNAIIMHLAENSRFYPEDLFERSKVLEWLFWEQNSHETTVATRRALLCYRGKKEDEIDPALLTGGNKALARMELQLNETPYLVGGALTLADIALVAYTRVAHEGGYDLSAYPAVKAWIVRVERDLGLVPDVSR